MKLLLISIFLIRSLTTDQSPVENFTLTNVVTGTNISLEGFTKAPGLAIIFTSNNCPFDRYYTDRLKNLINNYQDKIAFLLINAHLDLEETPENMKTAYASWGLPVPYLADKEQIAMNSLGARRSPEVYLLKKVNGKYFVIYSGAVDDNAQAYRAVTVSYFKDAMDKLLSGETIEQPSVRAAGCSIKKK